jgi:hypothetical protein
MSELALYRPLQRPVIAPVHADDSSERKRIRRIIVRDWFFFAIWASRLKKLFKELPKMAKEREKRLEEYKRSSQFLSQLTQRRKCNRERLETENSADNDEGTTSNLYIARIKQRVAEELAMNEELKRKKEMVYWGINVTVRCQEINFKVLADTHFIELLISVILEVIIEFCI